MKKQLEKGHLVVLRNGSQGVVNEDLSIMIFDRRCSHNMVHAKHIDEDLKCSHNINLDVMRIFSVDQVTQDWERKEDVPRYTLKQLREKVGEKFELILE